MILLCVTAIILQISKQGLITTMLQISAKEKEGKGKGKFIKICQFHFTKMYEILSCYHNTINK